MKEKLKQKYNKFKTSQFWFNFKRLWFEVLALMSLLALLWFAPYDAESKIFLFNVFITKFFVVTCGIIHAHISRQLIFPYIHFGDDGGSVVGKYLIIAWYVIIIWAWARGG